MITDDNKEKLTGRQKRYLRGLGHNLKPVVMIGKKEFDAGVIQETDAALAHHELIKVKVLENCPFDRDEAARELSSATGSEIAQLLGKTFLLYRKSEKPLIVFPSAKDQPESHD